jgi:hypothetical protein
MSEFSHQVEFVKSEREGKVFGVVLEANLPDSQGDVISPEEIEKACHAYMAESRRANVQHAGDDAGADLIENWIAPQDVTLGGRRITKGSWLQGWHVRDPLLKQQIAAGEITGFSIEGTGERTPVAA